MATEEGSIHQPHAKSYKLRTGRPPPGGRARRAMARRRVEAPA
jgi:hypothetical protein